MTEIWTRENMNRQRIAAERAALEQALREWHERGREQEPPREQWTGPAILEGSGSAH